MTEPILIRRGLDIRLAGKPGREIEATPEPEIVSLCPAAYDGLRPRLLVTEGDSVRRGEPLVEDKRHEGFRLSAPDAGAIREIRRGERRAIEAIVIERDGSDDAAEFERHAPDAVASLPREKVLEALLRSGYLSLIRQRPFSRIADPGITPDAVFVNGMATAPFRADPGLAVHDHEAELQAGLDALTRLTDGTVHLCLDAEAEDPASALQQARNVQIHHFRGPHPAGNSSVHLHHIDPIRDGRKVWTVRAADVVLIGHLLVHGSLPTHRLVALGGPGVREEDRRHYRVRIGAPLSNLVSGRLIEGEVRLIAGDVLTGEARDAADALRLSEDAVTVIREDRERHLLGWMAPGGKVFSFSRSFLSTWLARTRTWDQGTNLHGSPRAMVLTGLYDQVVPMRIRTDYLVRAILAHDLDEAVQLGLLEIDPEDFALCAFVCPSKVDIPGIIRRGLDELEAEEA